MQSQVPRHSGSSVIDNSGNSFSTYLAKENERIKRVENQRADAHEILIFVSATALHPLTFILIQNDQGGPTRSHSCDAYWCIYPGPPTRPTRQMGVLSGENVRITRRHQRAPRFPPFCDSDRSRQIFSADLDHPDQLVLVFEPGRQPDLHPDGLVDAAMGVSIQHPHFRSLADRLE